MKKAISLLLALITLLCLAACTPKATAGTDEKTNPAKTVETASAVTETSTAVETAETAETTAVTETPEMTEEEKLAKKLNNTATLTEDDLDVIHVGLYTFTLPDGRKIGWEGSSVLPVKDGESENVTFLVSFQNSGKDSGGREGVRYVIYTGDSIVNRLTEDYFYGISVTDTDDRITATNWNIIEHEDGTVSLKNVSSGLYLALSNEGDGFTEVSPNTAGAVVNFKMDLVSEGTSCFHQTISEKGNIVLRTNDKILTRAKLDYTRQAKWVNDLQTAYETYWDLTDYRVWESIIVRVYRPEPYFGYIYSSWNVISFDLSSAIEDLGKMAKRDKEGINDWNFCLMHEMGHMFDSYRCWDFEAEFCTNFKVAYNLTANADVGASAATAGFSYGKCFDGAHIKDMWNTCKRMTKSTGYNLDRHLYIFVDYAERIGWEHVREAYHEMQALENQWGYSRHESYDLLCNTIAKYAPDDLNVNDTMKSGELEVVLDHIDNM